MSWDLTLKTKIYASRSSESLSLILGIYTRCIYRTKARVQCNMRNYMVESFCTKTFMLRKESHFSTSTTASRGVKKIYNVEYCLKFLISFGLSFFDIK